MSVEFQQLLGSSLISFMLSLMLLKWWLPFSRPRAGEVLLEVPLGPLQRLLVHRTQAIMVLLYILIGSLPIFEERWFLPGTQPVAIAALAVIMMLPLRYVFTDLGVRLNNGVPRSFKTFRRFTARPGRGVVARNTTITLQGRKQGRRTAPSFLLFVPTEAVPGVTRLLKRQLK